MEVTDKEMQAVVLLLSEMTTYELGVQGLSYKDKLVIQLMFGRFKDYLEEEHE